MGGVESDTFFPHKYLLSIFYIPYNVLNVAVSIAIKIHDPHPHANKIIIRDTNRN